MGFLRNKIRGLDGNNPLAYVGVNPTTPANFVEFERSPTPHDFGGFIIGDFWIVNSDHVLASAELWFLWDKADGVSTWLQLAIGGSGFAAFFPTDDGTAVPASNILNIFGSVGGGPEHTGDNINTFVNPLYPNTVVVALNKSLHMPYTIADGTEGVWYTGATGSPLAGGNIFISNLGTYNTFVGELSGNLTLDENTSIRNSGFGAFSLHDITTGEQNTAGGYLSGSSITEGNANALYGSGSGESLVDGNFNCAFGQDSGSAWIGNESSNIAIGNIGILGESNTTRIGASGTGDQQQSRAFMGGIYNVTPAGMISKYVIVDETDQLGTSDVSPNGGIKVTDYDTPGSFTWTKDDNCKYVKLYLWGGGGGGGAGLTAGSATGTYNGGQGGGAGGFARFEGPALFFGVTEAVEVGAGGAGQVGPSVGDTGGADGGRSSFGLIATKKYLGSAGNGGWGGSAAITSGIFSDPINTDCYPITSYLGPTGGGATTLQSYANMGWNASSQISEAGDTTTVGINTPFSIGGTQTRLTEPANGNTFHTNVTGIFGAPTAGGTAAITNSSAVPGWSSGSGGDIYGPQEPPTPLVLAGGIGASTDGATGGNGNDYPSSGGLVYGGTGGGAGAAQIEITGSPGPGGNGGFPGGGGGGGGSALNNHTGQNGGDGGDGRIIVIEFLG